MITVQYTGAFPNLCCGLLTVTIGEVVWKFPLHCLVSGGYVNCCAPDDMDEVMHGPWTISEYPDGFPEELKEAVLDAVNEQVPWGCCGGCL